MDPVQLLVQGGSVGLLAYLIWWATKTGAPKLWDSLGGMKGSLDRLSSKVDKLNETNRDLTRVVGELAHESKVVGEETLTRLKKYEEKNGDGDSAAAG